MREMLHFFNDLQTGQKNSGINVVNISKKREIIMDSDLLIHLLFLLLLLINQVISIKTWKRLFDFKLMSLSKGQSNHLEG
jgi:hypothetical protein